MSEIFRKALQRSKKAPSGPSFYSTDWSYLKLSEKPTEKATEKAVEVAEELIKASDEGSSERDQVLESFTQFTQDKLEQRPSLQFPGGEIKPKESGARILLDQPVETELPIQAQNPFYPQTNCRVLFVNDDATFNSEPSDSLAHQFFEPAVAELFSKMVAAMKVTEQSFMVSTKEYTIQQMGSLIWNLKPDFVITLGAPATQYFLTAQSRLKNIHGKIFSFHLKDSSEAILEFNLMPIFSPKLLLTAPNMKRTAWADMQKAMQAMDIH